MSTHKMNLFPANIARPVMKQSGRCSFIYLFVLSSFQKALEYPGRPLRSCRQGRCFWTHRILSGLPIEPLTGLETELATGTGFWAIQPSLSVIFPTDPVVFFGPVNYLYSFSRTQPVQTSDGTTVTTVNAKVDPAGTFGFNFGLGFSMNEKTSFSFGYEQYIVGRTKVNNTLPPGAQSTILGSLLFGASYKVSDMTSINFSLEAGITEAAPDVVLTLRVPFSI